MNQNTERKEKELMLFEAVNNWYNNYAVAEQLAPETLRCYRLAKKHIHQYGENIPITEIKESMLQNILNTMTKEQYAKSTIDKVRYVLRASISFATRDKSITECRSIKLHTPKKAPTKKVDALTCSDQELIEQLCTNSKLAYADATLFLLHTGLRASELYNLEWSDYYQNNDRPYIYIRKSKTENGIRIVPLDNTANEIIKDQPEINKYIFTQLNGNKLTSSVMRDHNRKIRNITGIEKFHNHICRHSFATRQLENGMEIAALSKVLGHSSVAFTMNRYTTITADYIFEQMEITEKNAKIFKKLTS